MNESVAIMQLEDKRERSESIDDANGIENINMG